MQKFIVNIDNSGSRLDKFLAKNGYGFALAQKLLRQKDVKINSKKISGKLGAEYRLEQGDELEIYCNLQDQNQPQSKPKISEEKLNLIIKSIIYQDENLLAINKPSGIAVQAGNKNDFSIDTSLSYLKFEKDETPRLVHRLDRDTSGILLLARNRKTATLLTEGFKNKTINKTYLALVKGIPNKVEDTISMPLLEKVFGNTKKVFKDNSGKEAITHYKILKTFVDYSLLELKPITGRMHQLRVHCKEIGHPIIGDGKYSKQWEVQSREFDKNRLCLHSFKVEIADFFGQKLSIESEVPKLFHF